MGAAAAIAGAGAGVGVYSAFAQKNLEDDAIALEQRLAEEEATINEAYYKQQEKIVRMAGKQELKRFEEESERFISEQISGFAASGVESSSGSPLLKIAESRVRQASDRDLIRFNTENAANDFKFQSKRSRRKGESARDMANIQRKGAKLRLFTGVTQSITGFAASPGGQSALSPRTT